jgi:hypothetical protein
MEADYGFHAPVTVTDAGVIHSAAVNAPVWDASVDMVPAARYVRAQLSDSTGDVRALSNPVWAEQF